MLMSMAWLYIIPAPPRDFIHIFIFIYLNHREFCGTLSYVNLFTTKTHNNIISLNKYIIIVATVLTRYVVLCLVLFGIKSSLRVNLRVIFIHTKFHPNSFWR